MVDGLWQADDYLSNHRLFTLKYNYRFPAIDYGPLAMNRPPSQQNEPSQRLLRTSSKTDPMKFSYFRTYIVLFIIANALSLCTKKDTLEGIAAVNDANNLPVGVSAHDLLSADKYQSIKVEIQYMPGFTPDAGMLTNLSTYLSTYCSKPGGITFSQTAIAASGKTFLTLNEIAAIEANNRTVYTSGTQLGVYFLITDAGYSEPNVLGIAYRNTSMCIMGKTVHDNSGALGQASRTKLESTVTQHELGHIFGLVDLGSSMQTAHKDGSHGNHCTNTNCLMYYSSETTDILGFLITGNIPVLDANCKADLKANGGK